jgi:uncharacterized membrane protein
MFALVAWLSLRRWANFEANAYDLAFFDQVIWNTARGNWFETTFVPYSFAGEHIQPALLLFVPAYWFGAGPQVLLLVQALAVAAATFPLYALSRRAGLGPQLALAVVGGFCANPYLSLALLFDFHVEVLAVLPFFVSGWATRSERKTLSLVTAFSLLTFKEDAVFMVLALSSLMWIQGWRREAVGLAAAALAVTAVSVLVIMPHYRGAEESGVIERYGYLIPWRDDAGPLHGLALAPWRAIREIAHFQQARTVVLFVGVSCLVAVVRPRVLLWLAPGLLLALLSRHAGQRALEYHYAAELVPVALLAVILAAARLRDVFDTRLLAAAIVLPPMVGLAAMHPFDTALEQGPTSHHQAVLNEALGLIPDDAHASVSAQSGLAPRLSHRIELYEFPGHASTVDWVIVDQYGMRSSQSLAGGFEDELRTLRTEAQIVYSKDGVEVFRNVPANR